MWQSETETCQTERARFTEAHSDSHYWEIRRGGRAFTATQSHCRLRSLQHNSPLYEILRTMRSGVPDRLCVLAVVSSLVADCEHVLMSP